MTQSIPSKTPSSAMTPKMEFLANAMPQLVWMATPSGGCTYCNRQWYDYTGATAEQTMGFDWLGMFHPDDRKPSRVEWERANRTGTPHEIECRLYNQQTGAYRWVICRGLPYKDETNTIIIWYGTCTDINTQRRNAERQLFLSAASKHLSSTLDYTASLKYVARECVPSIADWCMIDIYDNKTHQFNQIESIHSGAIKQKVADKYRTLNPIISDQSSNTMDTIKSGNVGLFEFIDDALIDTMFKGTDTNQYMKSLHIRSGMIVPIDVDDKIVGVMTFLSLSNDHRFGSDDKIMAQDLADRIASAIALTSNFNKAQTELALRTKLEQDLREQADGLEALVISRTNALNEQAVRLERSNRELQDFAYVASHDLQEPLRKVQAFGDILQTEYADKLGDGSEYLDRMRRAAARMSTLIEDLLTFSRVSTRDPDNVPIDLNDVISGVVEDLESRIQQTKGTVTVGPLLPVLSDSTHMRQLFQNLIGNALKFHRADVPPVVSISCTLDDVGMNSIITIADNGIGFDEKYLDRIFSVFQRLQGRDKYEGTGIGLAVCRKIVERYNGSITALSTPGQGSKFIITLPTFINKAK